MESNPSEVTDVDFIPAWSKVGSHSSDTSRSGKWLLFVPTKDAYEIWRRIKKATEEGELGPSSKVSTAKPNRSFRPETKVICVYTDDWENEKDVMRVRQRLREMGFTEKISYKTDADTLAGKYSTTTRERISKYYC